MSDRKAVILFVELLLKRRNELLHELTEIDEQIRFLSKMYNLTVDFDSCRVILEE
mgnify:CR=1 FL=1